MTEGEMIGWHYRINGHEFEQTPGDSEGPSMLQSMGITKNHTRLTS